ncbi:unnamed protein product, partial [Rotaria sp. Silwood2]
MDNICHRIYKRNYIIHKIKPNIIDGRFEKPRINENQPLGICIKIKCSLRLFLVSTSIREKF